MAFHSKQQSVCGSYRISQKAESFHLMIFFQKKMFKQTRTNIVEKQALQLKTGSQRALYHLVFFYRGFWMFLGDVLD